MLSFRQAGTAVWLYAGCVVAAALAMNLRYKPIADGAAYVDTWTGKSYQAQTVLGGFEPREISTPPVAPEAAELPSWQARIARPLGETCAVRFAFPAPGTSQR